MSEDLLIPEINELGMEEDDENGSEELKKTLVKHCEKVGLKSEIKDFLAVPMY